jgi:hypothetical protein
MAVWEIPKKAGDSIPCPRCGGKGYGLRGLQGYGLRGLQSDYPVKCGRKGSGRVTVFWGSGHAS